MEEMRNYSPNHTLEFYFIYLQYAAVTLTTHPQLEPRSKKE